LIFHGQILFVARPLGRFGFSGLKEEGTQPEGFCKRARRAGLFHAQPAVRGECGDGAIG
jgi:hypothetical protein